MLITSKQHPRIAFVISLYLSCLSCRSRSCISCSFQKRSFCAQPIERVNELSQGLGIYGYFLKTPNKSGNLTFKDGALMENKPKFGLISRASASEISPKSRSSICDVLARSNSKIFLIFGISLSDRPVSVP